MYKKVPIDNFFTKNNDQLKSILSLPFVYESLQAGGMIAGGFVRQVLNNKNLYDYLSGPSIPFSGQQQKEYGDIDIFFQNDDQLKNVLNEKNKFSYINDLTVSASLTNLCTNICYPISFNEKRRIKIQLVSHFYGNPEDILETFDFTNIRCAITSEFIYFDDMFYNIENNRQLDVKLGNSPLTGMRILKYLNNRNLCELTNESRFAISEWAIRYGNKIWDDHPLRKMRFENSENELLSKLMKDERIFQNKDLINFIGTVILRNPIYNVPGDKYSLITGWDSKDLASDIIANRQV